MRTFLLTIVFFASIFSLIAQNNNNASGKITGRIIDSLTSQPIEYATISLLSQHNNKVVNGTTADSKGVFKISNIKDGDYKIIVDFIAYKRLELPNIILDKENSTVVVGDLKLASKQTALRELTINAEKALIENKIDKLIYNVEKDISSQGGVAADVLKKVPQVSVDVDGKVELQGNSSIKFLINGKPSILFGNNIADVLQSIPASQIKSIEVITIPGARYDAKGTGGIINIILKRNNAEGINGSLSMSVGTRLENGNFNINVRRGKFGMNAFFGGNAQLQSTTINKLHRTSKDSLTYSELIQNGNGEFNRNGFQSGVGFDWDISNKDNITASVGYDYFTNNNMGNTNRQTLLNDALGIPITNISDLINTKSYFWEHALEMDFGYKRKFNKEDRELEFTINSSNGNVFSNYEQEQRHINPEAIFNSSRGKNPGIENETNIELNYTHPLGEDIVFETGLKTILERINSVSDVYLLNINSGNFELSDLESSTVDFRRTIYSGYVSATFQLFDFLDIKAGCRNESTYATAQFSNVDFINLKPYNTIVPSIVLAHSIKKNSTIKLSYTHRIERPDYGDMNPFLNASDPKNITTGNPGLRPELGDKIELGLNHTFINKSSIYATLFYRGNRDDIQSYTRFYPTYKIGDSTYTNVAITLRDNIGSEDNIGLSLFASMPISEKLNLRSNISCYQRYIITGLGSGGNIQGFNYRANINGSYEINKSLIVEIFGNFNSPRINAQGTMPSFTTYNFALRKQSLNKKFSIAITATNFFDKYVNQRTELKGTNFTISNSRQLPYRSFGINLTYKFGKLEFKNKTMDDINLTNPPGIER